MVVFKIIEIQLIDNQKYKKMKKIILSIVTLTAVVFGSTNFSSAAPVNSSVVTTLSDVSNISKIEVYGNVELYISDASSDQVKVYNKYYSESAMVQNKNGVLRISSYTSEKLIVWVSANDLRSVSAYDNAEVKSFGELSKIDFNLDLHDNASAKLNLNAYTANITVGDHAKADLNGGADKLTLSHHFSASVNDANFKAASLTEQKVDFPVEGNDVAGI
jgi:hypothetical protein